MFAGCVNSGQPFNFCKPPFPQLRDGLTHHVLLPHGAVMKLGWNERYQVLLRISYVHLQDPTHLPPSGKHSFLVYKPHPPVGAS